MSVADPARPTIAAPPVVRRLAPMDYATPPARITPPALPAAAYSPQSWSPAPWRRERRPRRDGLSSRAGRWIAGSFAFAWILCPLVEPLPSGDVPYPLWQLPIDLATFGSMVAAVIVLWRGGRLGALLGAAAGVFMLLETAMCPIAGHTTVGWWTWAQTGLSLVVLGISAALLARQDPTA